MALGVHYSKICLRLVRGIVIIKRQEEGEEVEEIEDKIYQEMTHLILFNLNPYVSLTDLYFLYARA